jgi:hypothetical protein
MPLQDLRADIDYCPKKILKQFVILGIKFGLSEVGNTSCFDLLLDGLTTKV